VAMVVSLSLSIYISKTIELYVCKIYLIAFLRN
jgi:hypothetical protein